MSNGAFEDGYTVPSVNGEEWKENRRLILSELKRLGHEHEVQNSKHEAQLTSLRDMFTEKFDKMTEQLSDLKSDMRANERERKIFAGMFGFLGGVVPSITALIYFLLHQSG